MHALDPAPERGLNPGRVLLVRPDGFVAAMVSVAAAGRMVADLAAALPDRWSTTTPVAHRDQLTMEGR